MGAGLRREEELRRVLWAGRASLGSLVVLSCMAGG